MSDDLDALLAANRSFYDAFGNRDMTTMDALWSRNVSVACIHPGWDVLIGRDDVIESWRRIMANPAQPRITCCDEVPMIAGPVGIVVCHEVLEQGVLVASNTFVREAEHWRMIHHQSGPTDLPPGRTGAPPGPLH